MRDLSIEHYLLIAEPDGSVTVYDQSIDDRGIHGTMIGGE